MDARHETVGAKPVVAARAQHDDSIPKDPRHNPLGSLRLSGRRVFLSEWIKFRSLKSNLLLLFATATAVVAFGLMASSAAAGDVETPQGGPPVTGDPVSIVLSGTMFAVLLMGVLGVLIGAREYSSGMIRTSLAIVPSRLPVLWAKVAVLVAVALPAMLFAVVLAFFGGTTVLTAADVATASWSDPGVPRAVLGTAVYLVGIGIIGVGLGFLLRSIAGGLAALLGGVLILPTLAAALLPASWDAVLKYLPSAAGQAFTAATTSSSSLSPAVGGLVFLGWILVALSASAVVLARRDA